MSTHILSVHLFSIVVVGERQLPAKEAISPAQKEVSWETAVSTHHSLQPPKDKRRLRMAHPGLLKEPRSCRWLLCHWHFMTIAWDTTTRNGLPSNQITEVFTDFHCLGQSG